jgi:pimeloyl-ACP methyl ester carboxylesterase
VSDIKFTSIARENSLIPDTFALMPGKLIRIGGPAASAANDIVRELYEIGARMSGEQINIAGYSYGSVLGAHVALRLNDLNIHIDNLILIGSPIPSTSELYRTLDSSSLIAKVWRHDIEGDFLSNPKNVAQYARGALQNSNDKGPHFNLARPDDPATKDIDEGLVADEEIRKLALRLREGGVY